MTLTKITCGRLLSVVCALSTGACLGGAPAQGASALRTVHETEHGEVVATSEFDGGGDIVSRLESSDGAPLASMRWSRASAAVTWSLAGGATHSAAVAYTPTLTSQNLAVVSAWSSSLASTPAAGDVAAYGSEPCRATADSRNGCLCVVVCCPSDTGTMSCSMECWGACVSGGS